MSIARACVVTFAVAAATLCVSLTEAVAQSRQSNWLPLGCYTINNNGPDQGTIQVNLPGNPRFRAIRLEASGASVRMFALKVTFPDDRSDNIPVEGIRISSGERSDWLDLQGTSHEIRELDLSFSANSLERNRRICAVGQVFSGPPRNWVELGCQTVDFDRDFERFRVSNPNVQIESLRINVRDNDVRVRQFSVRYRSGRSEELTSRIEPREIKKDRRSRRIRLSQGPQRISEINVNYELVKDVRGSAVACVEGLEVAGAPEPQPNPSPDQVGPPPAGWDRLTCQLVQSGGASARVDINNDRDRFSAIQAQAFFGDVRINRLEVTTGGRRVIQISPFSVRRDETVARSFEDRAHRIRMLNLSARPTEGSDARAVVCLNARRASDGSRPDQTSNQDGWDGWKTIGCQVADTQPDFDVYQVGRTDGPFRAIRFKARNNDVWVRSFKIVFENGDEETVSTKQGNEIRLRRDQPSGALDLIGERRTIRRIQMLYRSTSDYRDAEVCIEGQNDRARSDDRSTSRRQTISDQPWQRRDDRGR